MITLKTRTRIIKYVENRVNPTLWSKVKLSKYENVENRNIENKNQESKRGYNSVGVSEEVCRCM